MKPETVSKKLLDIVNKGTEPFRKKLNQNVHVMDFSIGALKVSDPNLSDEEYLNLLTIISTSTKYIKSKSLEYTMRKFKSPGENTAVVRVLVEDPRYGVFLVTNTYKDMQSSLSSILKGSTSTSSLVQKNERGVWQANIGHIASDMLRSSTTPLKELLLDLIKRVPLAASNPIATELFNLQNAHDFDAAYTFQRENFNSTKLDSILGKSTVFVTLHSFEVNNTLGSTVEANIRRRIVSYLKSEEFKQHLVTAKGSPSIIDDIGGLILSTLQGKSYSSQHSKKVPSKTKGKVQGTGKLISNKLPAIRNLQGQFYSLTSLQTLLNTHLQDVVSANMGNEGYPGGQRRILNYRTGRFAESVKVERLSQSRAGAITAFYTYMRNPYEVFEVGHRMGIPLTRDPKLLIAKSIREIAATKVANTMRSVRV